MPTRYHLRKIRTLLIEGFTVEELRRFCFYEPEFNSVYNELAEVTGKADIADKIIEFAAQKFKLDLLLAWAKENNSTRYEQHQPYQELSPDVIAADEAPQTSPRIRTAPIQAFQQTNPANPFIDGPPVPPEKFIGREREIDVILDRLANPYNRGGSMVSGPSGIGKTSLLHYLLVEDTRKQWGMLGSEVARFIYIPTNLITPFSEFGFWEHLFYKLADWLEVTPGTEKVVKSLEAGKSPTRVDISRFFDKLGESKEKKFVVVLLDGFDRLMGEINKDNSQAGLGFLHTLRALLNLPAPRSFSLITSSERELFDLFANVPWFGSGFYSNLANLPLGPFSDIQIDDLIVSYLRNTGVNFDDRERNHLKRASSGHPQTLQRTAFELFEIKVASIGSIKAEKGEKKMAFDATLINIISSASTLLIDIARDVFKGRQAKRQDTQTSIEADTTTLATLPLDQPNELKTFLQQIDLANQKTKIDMIESLANQLTRHKRNWNDYSEEEAKPTASAAARVEARQLREDEEILIKRKSLMLKQQLEELTGRPIELSGLE